jgi:sulfite exporter TauE/SafE/plastocyanin
MNLGIIFLTGLTTGGISCMAVQGGLLASLVSNQQQRSVRTPLLIFLLTKLVAHIIVGFLLGWVGSAITLSVTARLIFQSLAALFMLATAANLLQLHPIFRYVVLQPPKFLQRWVRSTTKGETIFAPALLGVATIFIPCGVTQAMEVLAISTGSPWQGAAIMAAFTIGTMPIFALIGYLAQTIQKFWQDRFAKIAAFTLVVMGLWSINGVLLVLDAPLTFQRIVRPVTYFFSQERFQPTSTLQATGNLPGVVETQDAQLVTIKVTNHGYAPNKLQVKAGKPVQLTLQSSETYSCALSFILQEFAISVDLKPTDTKRVSFTPTKKGTYTFSCSMGMYSGTLEVI